MDMQSKIVNKATYVAVALCVALTIPSGQTHAQRVKGKPAGVFWAKGLSAKGLATLLGDLAEKHGQSDRLSVPVRRFIEAARAESVVARGTAFYVLREGQPSVQAVEFRECPTETSFVKHVRHAARRWGGERAAVSGSGTRLRLSVREERRVPQFRELQSGGKPSKVPVLGPDGKQKVSVEEFKHDTFFRFRDGVMAWAESDFTRHMKFPSRRDLQLDRGDLKVLLAFDASKVPLETKRDFWRTIVATMQTQLQRRDAEGRIAYERRRADAEASVKLLGSTIEGLESASEWCAGDCCQNSCRRFGRQNRQSPKRQTPLRLSKWPASCPRPPKSFC